jgi:hypothetical protein
MPQYLTIEIPVYPVVQKFLAYHYRTSPFVVAYGGNPYGTYLQACLDRFPTQEVPRRYGRLTGRMVVGIPLSSARHRFGRNLSAVKIMAWNKFVLRSFLDQLMRETAVRLEYGETLTTALSRVLERYHLSEDELSLDTLIRYYARHRVQRGQLLSC